MTPSNPEKRRREQVVDEWIAVNGPMCPGWKRQPHLSKDLTADHIAPLAWVGKRGG